MTEVKRPVGPINWNVAIVDPATGKPTPEFIRKWALQAGFNGDITDLIARVEALETAVDTINATSVIAGTGLVGGGAIGDGDITISMDPLQPWQPQGYVDGRPDSAFVIFRLVTKTGYGFEEDAPGSLFKVQTPPALTSTFPIRRNGSDIGTVVFPMGSQHGTLTLSAVTFDDYDTFEFFAPTAQDTTLADVSFLFLGYRDITVLPSSGWGYDWGNNWGGGS